MLQNQKLDLDLEVHKAIEVRQTSKTSMMYDCEVRVLLFIVFFLLFFFALLETPIKFSAFSAQENRYRVKILTGCQGSKG